MTADVARASDPARFVIDARYVEPKPSGIGRYVEALVERLPALDSRRRFELWTHPKRPAPVTLPNVSCRPVAAPSDGLRTLLTPTLLGPLRPSDVVHFPFGILGRGIPCATVVTIHDLMWLEQPELVEGRPWMRRIRRPYYHQGVTWALRHATRLIAVSEATRARIASVAPESEGRIRVTYNAVDARFAPPESRENARARAAELLGSAAPYYLLVGKNEPYKGHAVAVEAFARGARDDERLVLVQRASGGRGLLELAARLGVKDRVQLLPAVTGDDLISLLQAARALLQPSIVEGFGIPVLEAMACGCPVIASDAPALVEVSGGAGLHAAVGDASALAAAMARLRSLDRELLRQRGLARAASFSWDRTAAETLAIYEEAAAEHARSAA